MELPTSSDAKSSAAQLTIFYGGTINVYDKVTIDKAQAIMLLAGENSLSAPVVESVPTIDMTKVTKPVQPSNFPQFASYKQTFQLQESIPSNDF
ncbi:unnamed protein product [Ilex paraguariensis]|uniref:Protein TIFY n=1 Tax=Ilex paraguariensis TaxID=185542 RepID=A0ABC8RQU8_9AQUA